MKANKSHRLIDTEKIIKSWIISSDENFDTMMDMFKVKRYNWALFMGHLGIEKLLKAYYVKTNKEHAPFTHNSLRLVELAEVELTKEQKSDFAAITAFNINARHDL